MTVPTTSPAEQYRPQLVAATAARAAAAGGPDKIISGDDVDNYNAELDHADWQAVHQARRDLTQLRVELDRAEVVAAAAFAAAETRTAQQITAQRDLLNTEMRVLEVAGTYQPERALGIGPHALAGMSPNTAGALTTLAELPFTVTALHATPSKERTQALHTLHAATSAAGRNMLWCSTTHEQAEAAEDLQLADTATTISDAHTKLSSRHWQMPPRSLLIVDDAATARPEILADLAELAHQSQARLILISTTTTQQWPPQPSQRLLRLLNSELPWSMTLGWLQYAKQPTTVSPPTSTRSSPKHAACQPNCSTTSSAKLSPAPTNSTPPTSTPTNATSRSPGPANENATPALSAATTPASMRSDE